MNNIALFDSACSLIFRKLYAQFPISCQFDQRDIGFFDRWDTSDEADLRRRAFQETLDFLKAEGFITFEYYGDKTTYGICNARLTAKGLTKLQRIPYGIKQDAKPLIDQLNDAVSSIGDKASTTAVSTAVKHVLKLVLG